MAKNKCKGDCPNCGKCECNKEVVGIGEMQDLLPTLWANIGVTYIILDEKRHEIVGAIKVVEAPEELTREVTYTRRGDVPF